MKNFENRIAKLEERVADLEMANKAKIIGLSYGFCSPGIPSRSEPLPKKLHIGKKVIEPTTGMKGVITNHYIDGDDCSGTYGQHKYAIKVGNVHYSALVKDCKIIKK